MSKRKYIITDAARHGYIEEMRNDDKLKLTEEEYQYARRCLFMSIWNGERAWVSDEKFKTMDISSMFEEDGLMDLYENREEIFGDRLWSDIVRYYEWEKYISKKITQK